MCSAENSDRIIIPQNELYWTPKSGTASTIELTLSGDATVFSPNSTLEGYVSRVSIGQASGNGSTVKLTIPNTPGSLDAKRLLLHVDTTFRGAWENVTIEPLNHWYWFYIIESY